MDNLFNLVNKLKQNLLVAHSDNVNLDKWITPEEIHAIRNGLKSGEFNEKIINDFDFLRKCLNFQSVYHYFYSLNVPFEYDPEASIRETFDPLLIELMDNNYEISIRKIEVSDNVELFGSNLLHQLSDLENAYMNDNLARTTTLSSTLLQTLFVNICEKKGINYDKNSNLKGLYSLVSTNLKLKANDYSTNKELQKFCSKLSQLIDTIMELRNIYSDSHGYDEATVFEFKKLPKHHIKLIIDTTKTIVNFISNTYDYQNPQLKI